MNGKAKSNVLVKAFLDTVRQRIPQNLLRCPLQGEIRAKNILLSNKMLAIFPSGFYKISAHGYNEEDDNIMSIALLVKIAS